MKKRIYKDLNLELGMDFLQAKNIKAIDVVQLLTDISDTKPKTISEIFSVILKQQQYDLVIGE